MSPRKPLNFIQQQVARLRETFQAANITYDDLAGRTRGKVSAPTVHRIFSGQTQEPFWSTLGAIAKALDTDLMEEPTPVCYPIAGELELPVIATSQAAYGTEELVFDTQDPDTVKCISFAGLVLVQVRGHSAEDVVADRQFAIVDPNLHPDDAPPHPRFNCPIAIVRYRDDDGNQRQVLKLWFHHPETRMVTLASVNTRHLDERGLKRHIVIPFARVLDAWTVRGTFYG